jgi:hypothetical protein
MAMLAAAREFTIFANFATNQPESACVLAPLKCPPISKTRRM